MASEVVLVPHDRRWHAAAQDEAVRLLRVSSALVAVHHMGSTSIAGIVAKPIIDLLGVARDLASIDQERPVLEALGYEWRGEYGIAGRRYCISSDGAGRRLHHLHCYGIGDPAIVRHLAFRDHLRRLPSVAAAYEREKRRCAALHPQDGGSYTECKSDWIRRVEQEALRGRGPRWMSAVSGSQR